jgi:hypothetical protein
MQKGKGQERKKVNNGEGITEEKSCNAAVGDEILATLGVFRDGI